jgi:hypothetical protein
MVEHGQLGFLQGFPDEKEWWLSVTLRALRKNARTTPKLSIRLPHVFSNVKLLFLIDKFDNLTP